MVSRFSHYLADQRKISRRSLFWGMVLFLLSAFLAFPGNAHAGASTSVSPGWDIFTAGGGGYRYGPSIIVDSTLYIYYTWSSANANGNPILQTRVATASTSNANWPGSTTYQGVAISKRADQAMDSSDVKYIDAYSKFVAVNTVQRFTAKASIQMWESTDGINFTPSTMGKDNLLPYLHNDGYCQLVHENGVSC